MQKETAGDDAERRIIRYDEAARLLGIKTTTLQSIVSRKEIPHLRLGRRLVVFDRVELQAWLEARRVPGGAR